MKRGEHRSGLERLMSNGRIYRGGIQSNFYICPKKEICEDTKIRLDINDKIHTMAKENKCSIEIKTFLTEKYPTYEEYIIKMINQYFDKLNSRNRGKNSDASRGDER